MNELPLYSNRGQIGYVNPALRLVESLWNNSTVETRCPHLRNDEKGCYCSKCDVSHIMDGRIGRELQGLPCDSSSLQLFCLDVSRMSNCVIFKE
jgi:hypothetical protein